MNDLRHSFPDQQPNEPVFVFARPYPLAFVPTAAIFIAILAFSFFGEYVVKNQLLTPLSPFSMNAGIIFLGLFQLATLLVFFIAVFDFYLDILIVTDRRLVEISQEMLFFRRISELDLENVEDVSSEEVGLFQTVFNYGQVEVQTAGAKDNFMIENIYLPREVAAIVLDLKQQVEDNLEVNKRFPLAPVVGVINNHPIKTADGLEEIGALLHTEAARREQPAQPVQPIQPAIPVQPEETPPTNAPV
ncbi:MAG: PH domain-containing protein [bacterium]